MEQNGLVRICDRTLVGSEEEVALSFREKIEYCKQVDRLQVSVIRMNPIRQKKIDSLLIRSVCTAVKNATVAAPVCLDTLNVEETWEAIRGAGKARLQVASPVSSVQMEYLTHRKPGAVKEKVCEAIRLCRNYTEDVEFIAEDATRSDPAFLRDILSEAIRQGATTVTVCDDAGAMLPDELGGFLRALREDVPELAGVTLGFSCANLLYLADACAVAAVRNGAREIQAVVSRGDYVSLPHICRILRSKGSEFGVRVAAETEQINRAARQMGALFDRHGRGDFAGGTEENRETSWLQAEDSRQTVLNAARKLGYELNDEDQEKVWASFQSLAERKERISLRELDAIIAAEAMQVPAACQDLQYAIQTDNVLGAMARMRMRFHGEAIEGVSAGDGVVDAAFLAIEKAIGRHFELDDFQIQAITEGREAMGETVVKLRSEGKLYSGRGLSTDIVGSSVMAYINALNKIIFEEEEA